MSNDKIHIPDRTAGGVPGLRPPRRDHRPLHAGRSARPGRARQARLRHAALVHDPGGPDSPRPRRSAQAQRKPMAAGASVSGLVGSAGSSWRLSRSSTQYCVDGAAHQYRRRQFALRSAVAGAGDGRAGAARRADRRSTQGRRGPGAPGGTPGSWRWRRSRDLVARSLAAVSSRSPGRISTRWGSSPHQTRLAYPPAPPTTTAVVTPGSPATRNPFLPAYALNVTAIFHRVHGRWRLLRIVSGAECPANVPSEVRSSDLVVCERGPGLRKIP